MRIKRYVARTIQEALDTVRQDLGPDAVILHTRKARRGKLAGLFGGEKFEVIAALDVNVPGPGTRRPATGEGAGVASAPASGAVAAGTLRAGAAASTQAARARQEGPGEAGVIAAGRADDAAQAKWINPSGRPIAARAYESTPATRLVEMHERLLDMDVDPDLAEALIQAAKMKWREAQVAGKTAYELVLDL
ncbi:MAG: hypothetical protein AB1700_07640, partial [Bacillota bacterium]